MLSLYQRRVLCRSLARLASAWKQWKLKLLQGAAPLDKTKAQIYAFYRRNTCSFPKNSKQSLVSFPRRIGLSMQFFHPSNLPFADFLTVICVLRIAL